MKQPRALSKDKVTRMVTAKLPKPLHVPSTKLRMHPK